MQCFTSKQTNKQAGRQASKQASRQAGKRARGGHDWLAGDGRTPHPSIPFFITCKCYTHAHAHVYSRLAFQELRTHRHLEPLLCCRCKRVHRPTSNRYSLQKQVHGHGVVMICYRGVVCIPPSPTWRCKRTASGTDISAPKANEVSPLDLAHTTYTLYTYAPIY